MKPNYLIAEIESLKLRIRSLEKQIEIMETERLRLVAKLAAKEKDCVSSGV